MAGIFGVFLLASPAQAQDEHLPNDPWAANGESFIVSPTTIHLQDQVTGDTSIETPSLGLNINSGDEITVEYELENEATCKNGEPRVFAFVNGNLNKSVQCDGTGQAGITGTLSFVSADSGIVERVGLVYSHNVGNVLLKNLMVDEKLILFGERCEWHYKKLANSDECVPPATDEPKTPPTDNPPSTPTATPTEENGGSGGENCIDVNTATKEDLTLLRNVDEEMADRIIDARPFESVDDMRDVSGLGGEGIILGELVVGDEDHPGICEFKEDTGGGLPLTGASVGTLLLVSLGLAGAGAGLRFLGRRRN